MRISNQQVIDETLQALADEYSRSIMLNTIEEAKSVRQLSHEENIPISSAYRRVNKMNEAGLLTIERIEVSDDGEKSHFYRSAFRSIDIGLEDGKITLHVSFNEDVAGRLSRLWSMIRS